MKGQMRIDASHQTLRSRFFIPRRSIDLTGKIESRNQLGFERRLQTNRIEIVVFDSIGRLIDYSIFQAFNRVQGIQLDLQREGRGETLQVIFLRIPAFRFQEKLV